METFTKKNQTISVETVVMGWMAKDEKGAMAIINGIGKQEKHTAYRMNNIIEAYMNGTESELPAITFAAQTGQIIDGRHRVAVAHLLGIKTIKADLIYNI